MKVSIRFKIIIRQLSAKLFLLIGLGSFPFLFTFLFLSSFSARGQYYYVPEDGTMLAIEEEKQCKFSVSGLASKLGYGRNTNYGFQAGYSPRERIAIVGNFFKFRQNPPDDDESPESFRTQLGSIAIGTFFIKRKVGLTPEEIANGSFRGALLDFYMGYGLGNSFRHYEAGGNSKFRFQKYFIQAGVHIKEKRMGFSALVRYSILDFNKGKINGKFDGDDYTTVEHLKNKNPGQNVEFVFRFSVKLAKKIQFYFSNSTMINYTPVSKSTSSHFGLLFEIDRFSKASKKEDHSG